MMNRFIIPVMVFAATGLILSIVGIGVVLSGGGPQKARPVMLLRDDAAIGLSIPQFELIDQSGQSTTHELFDGRITIMDFMFTNCPFACPGMVMAMSEVKKRLGSTDVQFVSITVDPARDTPERLRDYARMHEIDTSRWRFLTGEISTINRIATDSLQFLVQPDENIPIRLPDGSTMANVIHPTKLILVGPDREVLGFYEYNISEDLDALTRRAREAARTLK